MTLTSTNNRVSYPGGGSTGPFAFPFRILAATDLQVYKGVPGLEALLGYGTDYTISGIGNASGTITLTAASSELITILRLPALTQPISIRNQGTYFPATIEDQLDRIAMQLQAIQDLQDRSLHLSEAFDPSLYDTELTPLANQVLAYNGTATGFASYPASTFDGTAASILSGFINVKDALYGAIGNGLTDDRGHLSTADLAVGSAGAVYLPPGSYRISSNLTFTATVWFAPGALLKIDSGVTVTLNREPQAKLRQIFDVSAGGSVTFATYNDVEANPIWFGADPNPGGADSTIAFQKWGLSGAKRLFIPWGQFDVRGTVLLNTPRLRLRGVGLNSSVYFNPTANNTPLFQTLNNENFVLEDFQVFAQNANAKTGLVAFDFTNAAVSAVEMHRVFIEGFNTTGIALDSAQHLLLDKCRFLANRSVTVTPAVCITIGSFVGRATIVNCRFDSNDKCLRVVLPTSLSIRECSFENDGRLSTATLNSVIDIDGAGAAAVSFIGNYVEAEKTGVGYAFLSAQDTKALLVQGNVFGGSLSGVTYTDRFIYCTAGSNARGISIRNNHFEEVITYFVEAPSQVARVHDNTFTDATVVLSTYNAVMALMSGRVELNNFVQVNVSDVPSIANGASSTSANIAVTGVNLGDQVEVTADTALQGLGLSASVQSAGQVRFTLINNTGGAVDLPSANYYFRVRKLDT